MSRTTKAAFRCMCVAKFGLMRCDALQYRLCAHISYRQASLPVIRPHKLAKTQQRPVISAAYDNQHQMQCPHHINRTQRSVHAHHEPKTQFLDSLTNNTTPFLHLCTEIVFKQTHHVLTQEVTTKEHNISYIPYFFRKATISAKASAAPSFCLGSDSSPLIVQPWCIPG